MALLLAFFPEPIENKIVRYNTTGAEERAPGTTLRCRRAGFRSYAVNQPADVVQDGGVNDPSGQDRQRRKKAVERGCAGKLVIPIDEADRIPEATEHEAPGQRDEYGGNSRKLRVCRVKDEGAEGHGLGKEINSEVGDDEYQS